MPGKIISAITLKLPEEETNSERWLSLAISSGTSENNRWNVPGNVITLWYDYCEKHLSLARQGFYYRDAPEEFLIARGFFSLSREV